MTGTTNAWQMKIWCQSSDASATKRFAPVSQIVVDKQLTNVKPSKAYLYTPGARVCTLVGLGFCTWNAFCFQQHRGKLTDSDTRGDYLDTQEILLILPICDRFTFLRGRYVEVSSTVHTDFVLQSRWKLLRYVYVGIRRTVSHLRRITTSLVRCSPSACTNMMIDLFREPVGKYFNIAHGNNNNTNKSLLKLK